MMRERTDACAVDIGFSGIAAGSPSPNGRPFVFVDASTGAAGWSTGTGSATSPRARRVPRPRLRGAGFASVRWTRVPGPTGGDADADPLDPQRGVLPQRGLGRRGRVPVRRRRRLPHAIGRQGPLAPFRAHQLDPDLVADGLGTLLSTHEIKKLFEPGQDIYQMATRAAAFAEAQDSDAGEVRVSLLQSLIASGVDPMMARVLNFYAFVTAADATTTSAAATS